MFIKHFIKQVDWAEKGVKIVRWEIIPIEPLDCDVKEFIKEKESLGWEVIGFSETADGMPAIYAEMDSVLYETLQKGDLHV